MGSLEVGVVRGAECQNMTFIGQALLNTSVLLTRHMLHVTTIQKEQNHFLNWYFVRGCMITSKNTIVSSMQEIGGGKQRRKTVSKRKCTIIPFLFVSKISTSLSSINMVISTPASYISEKKNRMRLSRPFAHLNPPRQALASSTITYTFAATTMSQIAIPAAIVTLLLL